MQGSRLTAKTVTEAAQRTLLKFATCDMHSPAGGDPASTETGTLAGPGEGGIIPLAAQAQAWGCRAVMLTRTRSLSTTCIGRCPRLGAAPRGPSAVFARSGKRPGAAKEAEDGPLPVGGAPIMRLCGHWQWHSLRGHRAIIKPRLCYCSMVTQITLRLAGSQRHTRRRVRLTLGESTW